MSDVVARKDGGLVLAVLVKHVPPSGACSTSTLDAMRHELGCEELEVSRLPYFGLMSVVDGVTYYFSDKRMADEAS